MPLPQTVARVAVSAFLSGAAVTATDAAPPKTLIHKVDAFAEQAFALGATPGMAIGVVVGDQLVYQRAFGLADAIGNGPVTSDTLWYVASISKSYTGFAIALLEAEGALSLSTPIDALLPNAQWHPGVKPSELPLRAFLAHTHGLEGGPVVVNAAYTAAIPESAWPTLLAFSPPLGSRELRYSNLGYNVAGMVIDRLRPEGWREFIRQGVFVPAGLADTHAGLSGLAPGRLALPHTSDRPGSFRQLAFSKRDETMSAAGGHVTTVADLGRWIALHMNDGALGGAQLLPAAVVRATHQPLATYEAGHAGFSRTGWGAGWDLGSWEGDTMVSRSGTYSGFYAHASFLPERKVGIVVMTNAMTAWGLPEIIAQYTYDLAAGRADAAERAQARLQAASERLAKMNAQLAREAEVRQSRQQPLPHPQKDYTGAYHHPGYGTMTWSEAEGRLAFRWGVMTGPAEVYDAVSNRLRIELGGAGTIVEFQFASPGPATSLEYGGVRFARISSPG